LDSLEVISLFFSRNQEAFFGSNEKYPFRILPMPFEGSGIPFREGYPFFRIQILICKLGLE
jgi:hypothetical protein